MKTNYKLTPLYPLFYCLLTLTFLVSSNFKVNAQDNKILYQDKTLGTTVYQSDLNQYIQQKNITDTIGKTKLMLDILSNAKARMRFQKSGSLNQQKKTYEQILAEAEEFIARKNLVNKVLVVKHERKMYLLKNGKTVKTFPIALGPKPVGQKEYEGDGKTPEGVYRLDWQKWNSSTFHSFHISYPNAIDSARAKAKGLKPGSNIMVHGTSKGIKSKKDWTNGCIALSNDDMLAFRKMVFQDTTIEIVK